MKNLNIWIIALITAVVFIFGIVYYKILDAVVNAPAFIISLTIIFLVLILVIIFSPQDNKKKKVEKPRVKIEEKKAIPEEKFAKTNFPQKLQTSHEEHFENSSKKEENRNYSNFSEEKSSSKKLRVDRKK